MKRQLVGAVVAILMVFMPRPSAGQSKTQEILARAASYVANFVHQFSNIVAEERYIQDSKPFPSGSKKPSSKSIAAYGLPRHVELTSDYLLVRSRDQNVVYGFRDVFAVNGEPVRDRQDRLLNLFVQPMAATKALEEAQKIAFEGARFTLGGEGRTMNNPLIGIGFLQAVYQSHFRFTLRGTDPELGKDVYILEFKEEARPTLMRQQPDGDLVAKGRCWVEEATGRVLKTEVTVLDADTVVTTFRYDERFQIAVPVEMREDFWLPTEVVTGVATYNRFRQFTVRTEEKFGQQDDPPAK